MRARIVRILAEMVVVFVGVYAAFALDQYRERKQETERRRQILLALEKDFSASQETLDEAVPQIAQVVDSVLSAYDRGEKPEIGHLAGSVTFRSGTWDAMLASGGVELLDIDLILKVEDYYETVQSLQEASAEGRRMSSELILPVIDQGNSVFYEAKGGKLKSKFRWYMSSLRDYRTRIMTLTEKNRDILEMVRNRLDGGDQKNSRD